MGYLEKTITVKSYTTYVWRDGEKPKYNIPVPKDIPIDSTIPYKKAKKLLIDQINRINNALDNGHVVLKDDGDKLDKKLTLHDNGELLIYYDNGYTEAYLGDKNNIDNIYGHNTYKKEMLSCTERLKLFKIYILSE